MELLNKPIICFPCGHSFCEKCKGAYENVCFECKRGKEPKTFKNRLFEEILSKIKYIKTTTEALTIVPLYNALE